MFKLESACGCAKLIKGRFNPSGEIQMHRNWRVAETMAQSRSGIWAAAITFKHCGVIVLMSGLTLLESGG